MSNVRHYPSRPPRLPQVFQGVEPFYFVTFNVHRRGRILANQHFHESFVEFCRRAVNFNVGVGRYVIMPDHVHLFARLPPCGMKLSAWIQSLKSTLGKTLISLGHNKPHWQEGFFDHLMRSSESYKEKWEYVRMNPVRAELCAQPEAWPYQGEIVPIRF